MHEFPFRDRACRVDGTRELVLAGLPWVAVYAVTDTMVVVLRLLHGAPSAASAVWMSVLSRRHR